jgi:hypothetical protein
MTFLVTLQQSEFEWQATVQNTGNTEPDKRIITRFETNSIYRHVAASLLGETLCQPTELQSAP